MASTTPNIGLTLPTGTEGWKRSVINGNFTILDTKIGAVGNTSLQSQINTLSSQIANKIKVKKLTLGSTASTSGGNFMLEFNAAETGYTPVSVISWNLQDRGQGGKVFITGFLINGNTAQVYGATNTAVTFNQAMTIDVLYIAN